MPAPTTDPIVPQILTALAGVLAATIKIANGFYTDVAGAQIEPLAFDAGDSYPQLVVQEEASDITDSNAKAYQDTVTIAVHGFLPTVPDSAYVSAFRLRDDITRVLRSVTMTTLQSVVDANGRPAVRSIALTGQREVFPSDLSAGFLEVVVRVQCDYRDFSPPVSGI